MDLPRFEYFYVYNHNEKTAVDYHYHNCFELTYYIEGSIRTKVAEKTYSCNASNFVIYPPFYGHDEIHLLKTKVLCLGFSSADWPSDKVITGFDSNQQVLNLLKLIQNETHAKKINFTDMCSLLTGEVLITISRLEKDESSDNDFLDVLKYIDENLQYNISLQELANISGYSYDHFRHLFKQKLGYTPYNYILAKKIEHAKLLLSSSSLKIANIATSCGFCNISQFSLSFRKYTGMSPTTYRKLARSKVE